jgi:hypothetical protein
MLVAGLVVTIGAVTLTSRALSLKLGSGLQDQAREARDAADSGFEAIIAELNRPENRLLASSNVAMQNWSADDTKLRNPCYQEARVAPTGEAINELSRGRWRTVPNNPNLEYRIRSAEVKNATRAARLRSNLVPSGGGNPTSTPNGIYNPSDFELAPESEQFSRLELTIEGRSLRNGVAVATSVITQELGVAPKCCGVSLGDSGTVPSNACASRFPRILVGLNGNGVMAASNGSELRVQGADTVSTTTDKPDKVLCVNSSGNCGGLINDSVNGVPIQTIKLAPPDPPTYPEIDNRNNLATGTDGYIIASNSIDNTADLSSANATQSQPYQDYLRVNSAGVVELCNATDNNSTASGPSGLGAIPNTPAAFVVGSCDSRIDKFCARTGNSAETYSYHCRIARLHVKDSSNAGTCAPPSNLSPGQLDSCEWQRIQNNTFFIDSSRGRIFLHFNQAWSNAASCGAPEDGPSSEVICTQAGYDDGQIQHLYCKTPPGDTSPCGTPADPDNSPRVTLYSDTTVNLKIGDDGFIRDLFVYMPKGTLTLAEDPFEADNAYGAPNYRGALWIDQLYMGTNSSINKQTQIAVPPFSSSFTGIGRPTIDNPFRLMPFYEWIVRGSAYRSLFGNS